MKFSPFKQSGRLQEKSRPSNNDVSAYVTYGTDRANAYRILEDTLNLKEMRIYDTIEEDGNRSEF